MTFCKKLADDAVSFSGFEYLQRLLSGHAVLSDRSVLRSVRYHSAVGSDHIAYERKRLHRLGNARERPACHRHDVNPSARSLGQNLAVLLCKSLIPCQ